MQKEGKRAMKNTLWKLQKALKKECGLCCSSTESKKWQTVSRFEAQN